MRGVLCRPWAKAPPDLSHDPRLHLRLGRSRLAIRAVLLSRVSCPAGNVANFVETEQQLTTGTGDMASFVEVRGSIPLLWTQVGHGPGWGERCGTVPAMQMFPFLLSETNQMLYTVLLMHTPGSQPTPMAFSPISCSAPPSCPTSSTSPPRSSRAPASLRPCSTRTWTPCAGHTATW